MQTEPCPTLLLSQLKELPQYSIGEAITKLFFIFFYKLDELSKTANIFQYRLASYFVKILISQHDYLVNV